MKTPVTPVKFLCLRPLRSVRGGSGLVRHSDLPHFHLVDGMKVRRNHVCSTTKLPQFCRKLVNLVFVSDSISEAKSWLEKCPPTISTYRKSLTWNQINWEHVVMFFLFPPVKSTPLETSFYLFGETTSESLNDPRVIYHHLVYLVDVGLTLLPEPRYNVFFWCDGVMKAQTAQKWKTTSDCRFPFCWWFAASRSTRAK